MTKTKIICTLGPATDKPGILEALVQELEIEDLDKIRGSAG